MAPGHRLPGRAVLSTGVRRERRSVCVIVRGPPRRRSPHRLSCRGGVALTLACPLGHGENSDLPIRPNSPLLHNVGVLG